MALTLEQQAARLEAKLARVRGKARSLENGQKIIAGGLLLAEAERNPRIREWFIAAATKSITREVDRKRIHPVIERLTAMHTAEKLQSEEPRSARPPAVPSSTLPANGVGARRSG